MKEENCILNVLFFKEVLTFWEISLFAFFLRVNERINWSVRSVQNWSQDALSLA